MLQWFPLRASQSDTRRVLCLVQCRKSYALVFALRGTVGHTETSKPTLNGYQ